MEENEYRETYQNYNEQRCLFEKSILSRKTMCEHAHRFCLADREGVACKNLSAFKQCKSLLNQLRNNARFALKQTNVNEPLPHAKEVKIQTGGLLGLRSILDGENAQEQSIENIFALIQQAITKYGELDSLPYDEITRQIVQFKGKTRSRSKK